MSLTESATPNHSTLPNPLTANEEVPRINNSVMIPLEPDCSNNFVIAPTGANLAPATATAHGPITESATFIAEFIWNCFKAHLNKTYSTNSIHHNKPLELLA